MQVARIVPSVPNQPVTAPQVDKRYFQTFYKSFEPPAAPSDDVHVRLQDALIEGERACRCQIHRLEQQEHAVICQGFAAVLGRAHPTLIYASTLAIDEAEAAHRAVVRYECVSMQLQACVYQELLARVNLEVFVEPQERVAIEGKEVPQWVSARQRHVAHFGAVTQEGTLEYQRQQLHRTRVQQLTLLHVTEAEERIDIERQQLLYIGAFAEVHKKRLRDILPKQAKYVTSHVVLRSADSEALIALESTQRLGVTFSERDSMKRLQADEVLALFRIRTRN